MATVTSLRKPKPRRHLGPEPWGHLITRAREGEGYTLRGLDRAKRHLGFGRGPIHALEQLDEIPDDVDTRRRAFVLLTFLGYDPVEFGLDSDDDEPSGVIDLRTLADLGESPTKWYTDGERTLSVAA